MVATCCAYLCKSRSVKGGPVTFHCFPLDPQRRALWEAVLFRKGFKATKSSRLCSKHFEEHCFDKEKLGGSWLKKDAVPTIFNFSPYLQNIKLFVQVPKERSSTVLDEHSATKEDSPKFKRLRYVGDFNEKDLESPENARLFLSAVKRQKALYRKRVRALGQKNKTLQKKVAFLTKEIQELKGKTTRPVLSDSNPVVVIEDIIEVKSEPTEQMSENSE